MRNILKEMIGIAIEGKDRYYQSRHLPSSSVYGKYHEPIGDGVYVTWPTKKCMIIGIKALNRAFSFLGG